MPPPGVWISAGIWNPYEFSRTYGTSSPKYKQQTYEALSRTQVLYSCNQLGFFLPFTKTFERMRGLDCTCVKTPMRMKIETPMRVYEYCLQPQYNCKVRRVRTFQHTVLWLTCPMVTIASTCVYAVLFATAVLSICSCTIARENRKKILKDSKYLDQSASIIEVNWPIICKNIYIDQSNVIMPKYIDQSNGINYIYWPIKWKHAAEKFKNRLNGKPPPFFPVCSFKWTQVRM